jgi:hypothetical protein
VKTLFGKPSHNVQLEHREGNGMTIKRTYSDKLREWGVDQTGSGLCGFSNGAVFWYVTPSNLVQIYTNFVGKFKSMYRQSSNLSGKVGKSLLYFFIPFHNNDH